MFFIALIMLSFAKPPADLKSITYLLSSPPAFWYNSSPYFDFHHETMRKEANC